MNRRSLQVASIVTTVLLVAAVLWWHGRHPLPPPPPPGTLSSLAQPPDWSRLDPYQGTLTRAEFELLLTSVFTTGDAWRETIRICDRAATIDTGEAPPRATYALEFRRGSPPPRGPHYWRAVAELPPAPPGKPLAGVRIAIDPGHIGGEWAVLEERNLVAGGNPPVREGDLTLTVAKLLKPRLEALGANVLLVRDRAEPLTQLRPADLEAEAAATITASPGLTVTKLAERLFYRTAEIRARADQVNHTLKPDLVLCLHFNADAWGSPSNPLMVDRSHLHLLVSGAFSDSEIALADQRFSLLLKMLQGTHDEELGVASAVAGAMVAATGLPPFQYRSGSSTVRPMPGQPYVYARNLLANRLYECPVVYPEPYVMNARGDYARILAGDYDGLRQINGSPRPSIFREYADSLTKGLADYYNSRRSGHPTSP
jgi:hypothetical protein